MWSKMGTVPPGTSGSYTPVQNVAFVAREYFPDCDDEVCEYELTGFQLLSELESRKLMCCGWLMDGPEQPESFYNDDDEELEDGASECEDDYGFSVEEELVKTYGKPSTGLIRGENPTPGDEPEVEVVEKATPIQRRYSNPGYNHKGRLRTKIDRKTYKIIRTYFSQGQRCYGGQDNRRLRRDDATGKVIGHNHRRRYVDYDFSRNVLRPVAIILDDGTTLRVA